MGLLDVSTSTRGVQIGGDKFQIIWTESKSFPETALQQSILLYTVVKGRGLVGVFGVGWLLMWGASVECRSA